MSIYNVGDKIVHPLHGAGIIAAIEEKQVLGQKRSYYVLDIPTGFSRTVKSDNSMKVMIPIDNTEAIGVRDVISEQDAKRLLQFFKELEEIEEEETINWNKRYKANSRRLKTGNLDEVAYVLKTLMKREAIKPLSGFERRMLSDAKKIMITELVLALNKEFAEIEKMLDMGLHA